MYAEAWRGVTWWEGPGWLAYDCDVVGRMSLRETNATNASEVVEVNNLLRYR